MNGRVVFDNTPGLSYNVFENSGMPNNYQNSLKSIQTTNVLSKTFFSNQNVENLHMKIVSNVSKQAGYRIAKQSDTQLQIIMRSIYLQYSNNLECNIQQQVNELNKKVLDYCVERIIVEISQFLRYKNDVSKMPTPMNHPQNLSNSGEKSLSFFKPL